MSKETPAWRKENIRIEFDLSPGERVWRNRQRMLERHGYLLRPRFRPDWVPSWLNTAKRPLLCEDGLFTRFLPFIIDAERLSDGLKVMLKVVDRDSKEAQIGTYLSSQDHAKDPTNHCVPILDIIRDESEPCVEFIVMPVLRPFDHPPFFNVEEVLDFMKQALQGLVFMHKLGVAHREKRLQWPVHYQANTCSNSNIMFDAVGMFPKGFHPCFWDLDTGGKPTIPLRRSDVPRVKYFFTDFGISSRFLEGEPRLVLGLNGLDRDVPELSGFNLYDPFPVDVFILGNVFKRNFTSKYTNMQFMASLVEAMTHREPTKRPSASEALARYEEIASALPGYVRRRRLKEIGKGNLASLLHDIGSLRRECSFVFCSMFKACSCGVASHGSPVNASLDESHAIAY
ncbi:hypothetical protein ACEPAI_4396 [Sanghuangporus weigelae]